MLETENDSLKLYVASLMRILITKGVCSSEEIAELARIIDREDGVEDGKSRGKPV